jgi:hypothetical protein
MNEVKDSERDIGRRSTTISTKVPNKDMFHYKDSDMVNQNGWNHQQ